MAKIFLESHNIENLSFGFGQFNYHLIKGIYNNKPDLDITLHTSNISQLKEEFGHAFNYKKYYSLRRYPIFRIRENFDLWHCLNQNIKIEPYHKQMPYVLTIHDTFSIETSTEKKTKENFKKLQDKLNRSSAITYISNYAKASTHELFDVPKVPEYVIYNGNTMNQISLPDTHEPRFKSKTPFLFSIGEISERKNFKSLIPMMELLKDHSLIIAGKHMTKTAEEITRLISKYNLNDRVFLIGKISELDKQYYYKHCTAFTFPSLKEGFGLPVLEAMSFGKPVFLSNKTSLPEIGGNLAFYWNNFDAQYMYETLINGLNTYNADVDNYKNNSIIHSKLFSWNGAAKAYIKVYKQVINVNS